MAEVQNQRILNSYWSDDVFASLTIHSGTYTPLPPETGSANLEDEQEQNLANCTVYLDQQAVMTWIESLLGNGANAPEDADDENEEVDLYRTVGERSKALQQRAEALRKEHPRWPKPKIAKLIFDNDDFQKHKGEGKLSAEAIEREIRLPRPKQRTPR